MSSLLIKDNDLDNENQKRNIKSIFYPIAHVHLQLQPNQG